MPQNSESCRIGYRNRMDGVYLDWYVADLTFSEDRHRKAMSAMTRLYVSAAMAHPVNRDIAG